MAWQAVRYDHEAGRKALAREMRRVGYYPGGLAAIARRWSRDRERENQEWGKAKAKAKAKGDSSSPSGVEGMVLEEKKETNGRGENNEMLRRLDTFLSQVSVSAERAEAVMLGRRSDGVTRTVMRRETKKGHNSDES